MRRDSEPRGSNFYLTDTNLRRLLGRIAPQELTKHEERLVAFGAWVGGDVDVQAAYTDRYAPPVLETYDRHGTTVNRIVYNPRYEAVHRDVYRHGFVGLNYGSDAAPYLLTFAMGYLLAQADISIHCPATLTGAVAFVLDRHAPPAVKDAYLGDLIRTDGKAKTGGTWATELDAGSDVGATRTVARQAGGGFELTGLKWFASNADGDLALVTARPEGAPSGTDGLGLYLVPSHLPDGALNRYRVRRLKDKLGTRGLATGEIDLFGAHAVEVAPPPEGFRLMMEAIKFSRIHNAVAAAGVQRRAFLEAAGYASRRTAFGNPLASYPMIQDGVLDTLVQVEAGVALAFEAARTFDAALADDEAQVWLRTSTALAKYQTAEQAIRSASQAIEVLGGNGYTEEYVTARLLRDAQVLTVWEGPANIQALELLRLVAGRYSGLEPFANRIEAIVESLPSDVSVITAAVKAALDDCRAAVAYIRDNPGEGPRHARKLLDLMADTLGAALLVEEAAADLPTGDARKALIARRFVESRLHPPARRGIGPGQDWSQRYFEPLVACEPVEMKAAYGA